MLCTGFEYLSLVQQVNVVVSHTVGLHTSLWNNGYGGSQGTSTLIKTMTMTSCRELSTDIQGLGTR